MSHGPKRVSTGSKWAKNTCLSTPNGPKSLLQAFFTLFWSQNGPFSRHLGIFYGQKRVTTGSKWAKNTCLSTPNGPRALLVACLIPFGSQNGPSSRHVGFFHGPKRVPTGTKWAKSSSWRIPNGARSLLEKLVFDRFLTHFSLQNRVFQGILAFSMGQNASPRAQNGLKTLEHPEWSKSTFGSVFDPFLVPKRPLFKACWDFPRAKTRTHGYKMGKKQFWENPEWCRVTFGEARF